MNIYKATITSPFGKHIIAVASDETGAATDIMTAATTCFKCHPEMIRVKTAVTQSHRSLVKKMIPIARCITSHADHTEQWGWVKVIKNS